MRRLLTFVLYPFLPDHILAEPGTFKFRVLCWLFGPPRHEDCA
jgi:hypothetical protein